MSQPFNDEERAALDAWQPPEMPADFVDRVVDHAASTSQHPKRHLWVGAAVLALAAGGAWLAFQSLGGPDVSAPRAGELTADARETARIGAHAVAVAEPGAALRWRLASDEGPTRIVQSAGDTFYRVDAGPFEVQTPLGTVRVLGTCFRIDIVPSTEEPPDMQRNATPRSPLKTATLGALAGASLSALVLVTVYEGRVQASAPDGTTVEAGPGETIELRPEGAPQRRASRPSTSPVEAPRAAAKTDRQAAPDRTSDGAAADREASAPDRLSCPSRLADAEERADYLEGQVDRLKKSVEQYRREQADQRTYDLSQDQLEAMASHCELRWDHPGVRLDEPPRVWKEAIEDLQLSEAEVQAANEAFAANNERMLGALRALYVEVTGDTENQHLAPDALVAEITDKTEKDDVRHVFKRLSAERAGLVEPPADLASRPAIERLFRLLTTSGDLLEEDMASRFGPELARELRDHHNGWGSKSRSRPGCPPSP